MNMERFNVFLPRPLMAKLRGVAKKTGLSVAELIRRALDDYLAKNGD